MRHRWEEDCDPLSALAAGDGAPFERFVRCEARTFVGFFRHLGADLQEAEDLAQDLFMRLYDRRARYRPRGRVVSYCYRVARNVWIDRQRRRAVRPALAADSGTDASPADRAAEAREPEPPAALARGEEACGLRRALQGLSESQRLAFELGVVRGLPYGDVAEVLDVPVGTVKSRIFYAVRRLREQLAPARASARGTP